MKYLFFLLFLLVKLSLFSQPIYDDSTTYCIAFYNVENLFDTEKDSIGNDGAFTPSGSYRWTKGRYIKKVNNIAKVFLAIHGWNPPDIIGLAEVENEKELKQLCYYSPLKKYDYHYVPTYYVDGKKLHEGAASLKKIKRVFDAAMEV